MKICVIGAGPSGLITAKHSKEHGHDCEIFEQTNRLGGIWNYTDDTDVDENEAIFRSPIYKDLKTLIQKDCMALKDFPYSSDIKESYIGHALVLDYFHKFADHFNLNPLIKYSRRVLAVKPTLSNKWEVVIEHVDTKTTETTVFDAIMVCNGHFSIPHFPTIEGRDVFEGIQMHSIRYREPSPYKDKVVLVIGAGLSGEDIAKKIATIANHVFLSRRNPNTGIGNAKLTEKPEVVKIWKNHVEFKDGERLKVDVIIYATGYLYDYPFLSTECKIKVNDNWVQYLYKHIVNMEFPTMFFIGIVTRVAPLVHISDIQARFALSVLGNKVALPSKHQMLDEILERHGAMKEKGIATKYYHHLGIDNGRDYFDSLSTVGRIDSIQPVLFKIFEHWAQTRREHLYVYRIIDDDNFEICE